MEPSSDRTTVCDSFVRNTLLEIDKSFHCDYRDDIWRNLLEQEADRMVIHLQSPQLEYRGALVTQLREVCKALSMDIGTLHAAVLLLDLFMDSHRLRSDRLTHVALACLSLAAKSEEKHSVAPTLKTLSKVSKVQLCGKTFRQLEWMIGEHVKWRLLLPTPATFGALLAQFVVMEEDLLTPHPTYIHKLKQHGQQLLEAYLDLTLSDVRLRTVESSCVACACVAAARASLRTARVWPPALARRTHHSAAHVQPTAGLLLRMMQVVKSREKKSSDDVDLGYGSAKSSPTQTPSTSPQRACPEEQYSYYRSQKLLDALTADVRMSVKRPTPAATHYTDTKRACLAHRMAQVTL